MKFKVIIAGGRNFDNYELLVNKSTFFLQDKENIEIISGTANGADNLGENYAKLMGYGVKRFPANWTLFGKSAGYRRNKEMAEYADALIVFWDGKSKGSKHMIDLAKKMNLKIRIINY